MVPFHVGEVDGFVDDMVDEALDGVAGCSLGFHAKVSWGFRLLLAASFRERKFMINHMMFGMFRLTPRKACT